VQVSLSDDELEYANAVTTRHAAVGRTKGKKTGQQQEGNGDASDSQSGEGSSVASDSEGMGRHSQPLSSSGSEADVLMCVLMHCGVCESLCCPSFC